MANNVMNMDGSFKPFRFWCQHVLPQVYDDSLSYMELLNKVITYINSFGEYLEEYTVINKIVYEGIWDITKNYKINSVVSDSGYGYLSIQAVPAGVPISATDYWLKIADFAGELIDLGERVLTLEGSMTQAEADIDALESSMGTAETDISGLKTRMTTAEGNITGLRTDVNKLINTNNYFNGKNIVAYGDSTIKNSGNNTYMDQLGYITGATVTNRGVAGTRMASGTNNGVSLINDSTDLDMFDIITLSYGTNEWQNSDSLYEVYESCKHLINAIRNKNPNIQIIFICPPYAYHNYGNEPVNLNTKGLFLDDVINCITYYMNSMSIPVIDLYHLSPCNALNYSSLLRNDSGGIYVHPTDAFATTLALIIKDFNGGAISSYTLEDVLCPYDFYNAQAAYTDSDYAANNGFTETGLYLRFTNAMSDNSVSKVIFSSNLYKIVGNTTEPITLIIGTYSKTIPAGKFNFDVNNISTAITPIMISSTNTTVITDFHIYKVNLKGSAIAANAPAFGSRYKLIKESSSITFLTGSTFPTIRFTDKGLDFDFSGFQVTDTITPSTELMSIPGNFTTNVYMHHIIPIYNSTTGLTETVEIVGNKIRSTHTMATGLYILMGSVNINKCPLVIN